jgi:hypothetical protein
MSLTKFAVIATALSLLAGPAAAGSNIYGAWKGKIRINLAAIPASASPQVKESVRQQAAMVQKTTISLNLSKDKTFSMKVSGSPVPSQNATTKGTWTLRGNQLTIFPTKTSSRPNPFTIAKDGKSFSVEIRSGLATMKFTR